MRLPTIIKLLGLIILVVLLWRIDLPHVWRVFQSCNLSAVFFALLTMLLSAFIKSYRWHLMMRQQGIVYPIFNSFKCYLVGLYIGTVTPGRLGELSRALYVKRDLNLSIGQAFSGVVVDRLLDLHFLLTAGLSAVYYFHFAGEVSYLPAAAAAAGFLVPVFFLLPGSGRRLLTHILQRFSRSKLGRRQGGEVARFLEGVQQLLTLRLLWFGLITAVAYAIFFAGGYLLSRSIHISASFQDVAAALALANLLSLVPITVAGVGTRDAALVLCLGMVHVPSEAALALSILILLTSYFGTGIIGFLFFIADKPPHDSLSD